MDIEWQEGAVCFAYGKQVFACNGRLLDSDGFTLSPSVALEAKDFQLNTIKQGDCIEVSKLDTEQKYNDAVEVFGLFGFVFKAGAVDEYRNFGDAESLTCCDDGLWQTSTDRWSKRKLTYQQLMAIGDLKRLELERDNRDAEDMFVNDKSHVELSVDGGEMSLNSNSSELVNKQEVKIQKNKPVVAQVMIDLTERMEIGIKTYGEALRANNGRDALQDAYEEALDLACYLKQAMIERDNANTN